MILLIWIARDWPLEALLDLLIKQGQALNAALDKLISDLDKGDGHEE